MLGKPFLIFVKIMAYDIKQSFTFRIDCFFVSFDAKLEIKKLEKNGTVNAKINLIENL